MPHAVDETRLPVERPPDEVLALIFKAAADSPLSRGDTPAPLTISYVSRRWRAVALSSPEIWTTIRISARHHLSDVSLFLERSAPLHFRLSINTESCARDWDAHRIFDILLPHVHRCSALALCANAEDLRDWSRILQNQNQLEFVRILSVSIHSYAPDELWGPPASLLDFAALCTGLRWLRLSAGPRMTFAQRLNPLQLTKLDVRCTWDGAFVRHVCYHSPVLEALVLRDYSACVFDGAAPTRLPSLTSLALEYRDTALAEGLINLAHFVELPNLIHLAIEGSTIPDVGYPLRRWETRREFRRLKMLSLQNVICRRPIDRNILAALSANITHLQLMDGHSCPFNDAEIRAIYRNLRAVETPRGIHMPLSQILREKVIVRDIPAVSGQLMCGELDFYLQSDGSMGEFERDPPVHLCSDLCDLHNLGPWREVRSAAEYVSKTSMMSRFAGLDGELGYLG
ncbi:F-box domain-containing protein [Mycena sanguinolenta]|uniref:F-box domain-containing protein n=1 Tax=Mycena sanguinolenta TaxID=230812 RepID=A0A8H7D9Z0_9AGAR|nr:F-box domain-containing protein [Mycena sanguinolenta]